MTETTVPGVFVSGRVELYVVGHAGQAEIYQIDHYIHMIEGWKLILANQLVALRVNDVDLITDIHNSVAGIHKKLGLISTCTWFGDDAKFILVNFPWLDYMPEGT